MDLAMPTMNGLEAARQISRKHPRVHLILVTVQQLSAQLAEEAQNVGFRAAVCKNTGIEVVHAVEALLHGEVYFPVDDWHAA
jgi:DNA-binding NarL/FixJ family response regulator